MYRRRNSDRRRCGWAIAFGIGLLVASVCTTRLLVIVLAVAIITLGCCR